MRYRSVLAALAAALAFAAAGCGGDDGGGSDASGSEDVSGSVSVMAIWAGEEQESFQAVIDDFEEKYPNVSVKYTSGGDNLAPLLTTAVEGGNPPTIAALGQPGLMADFAKQNAIKPIDDLRDQIVDAFGEDVADAGAVDGTQYGVMFKGANKSTIWYNVATFDEAGVEPPETWDDLDQVRDTVKAAGITPYSVGVDVGWPITDMFENVYIRTRRPGEVRPAGEARDPVDRPVREGRSHAHEGHRRPRRTTWPAARTGRSRRRCRTRSPRCSATTRRPRWSSSATSLRASPRRRSSRRRASTSSPSRRSRARSRRWWAAATSSSSSRTLRPRTRSSST